MKTVKSIKKIVAFAIVGIMALSALTGCAPHFNQDDINNATAIAYEQGVQSVDITSDNAQYIEEIDRLNQVIEDAKEIEKNITKEDESTQMSGSDNSEGYDIDDVALDGNFKDIVDSDDLEKLYYIDSIDYEDEDYVVEEKLYVTNDVKPVLNLDDLNGEVAVEFAQDDAVKYMVEFDQGIEFDNDSTDTLNIDFLGQPMKIVNYENGEVTIRLSNSYVLKDGDSVVVDGKTITMKGVNDDSNKVYVDVNGVSESIKEGRKKTINGIEVYAEDVFSGDSLDIAELYIGDDVEDTITDGDEYDNDDNYEWVVTETNNELTGIGLIYTEDLVDDDEVLKLGDSFVLPNEYLKLSFSDIKDMEGKDLKLSLNTQDIDLKYDDKIEIDGNKVENSKISFYKNDAGDIAYEYRYKGDKYDNETDLSKIVIFNDNRELSVSMNDTIISVYDADVNYSLSYVFGDNFESVANTLTSKVNDDDDYRVVNGDLMYKSDLNENDEDEDEFVVSLKNQEEVELVLRVE